MNEKLTNKMVDAAKPRETRYAIWDSVIPGLGVIVHPSGIKSFVLKYRTADGTQRKPLIGTYGKLTVQQARKIANEWASEVRAGEDPSGARKGARKGLSMSEACQQFMRDHASLKKPNTRSQYQTAIDKYVVPELGSRKIASVNHSDVARLIASIGKSKPVMANRVRAMLSKLFELAELWGARPLNSNPVRHVERYRERKRHRDLSEIELRRLATALAEVEAKPPCAIDAIRFLLFTGMRRGEVLELRWSEVDLDRGFLRLGDSKSGQKVVRLNSAAEEILERLKPEEGKSRVYVFESAQHPKDHITEWELRVAWEAVRAKAQLNDLVDVPSMRLHDLRHNFASWGASQSLSLLQIGALLGHKSPRTTARYADLAADAAHAAAETVGHRITEAMESTGETE